MGVTSLSIDTALPASASNESSQAGGRLCLWIGPVNTNSAVQVYFNRNHVSSNDKVRFGWRTPTGDTHWSGWATVPANGTRMTSWNTWITPGWNAALMTVTPASGDTPYTLEVGAWA